MAKSAFTPIVLHGIVRKGGKIDVEKGEDGPGGLLTIVPFQFDGYGENEMRILAQTGKHVSVLVRGEFTSFDDLLGKTEIDNRDKIIANLASLLLEAKMAIAERMTAQAINNQWNVKTFAEAEAVRQQAIEDGSPETAINELPDGTWQILVAVPIDQTFNAASDLMARIDDALSITPKDGQLSLAEYGTVIGPGYTINPVTSEPASAEINDASPVEVAASYVDADGNKTDPPTVDDVLAQAVADGTVTDVIEITACPRCGATRFTSTDHAHNKLAICPECQLTETIAGPETDEWASRLEDVESPVDDVAEEPKKAVAGGKRRR